MTFLNLQRKEISLVLRLVINSVLPTSKYFLQCTDCFPNLYDFSYDSCNVCVVIERR